MATGNFLSAPASLEPFLFEELPAIDQQTSTAFLAQVASCDIYLGLFGDSYGFEDAQGVSPTEHEFNCATEQHKVRLIYVKGEADQDKHPKMQTLMQTGAGAGACGGGDRSSYPASNPTSSPTNSAVAGNLEGRHVPR